MTEKVAIKQEMAVNKEVLLIGEIHQDLSENPQEHGKLVGTLMRLSQAMSVFSFESKTRSRINTINSALQNEPGNILLVEVGEAVMRRDVVLQEISKNNIIVPMDAHTFLCIHTSNSIFQCPKQVPFKDEKLDRKFEVIAPLLIREDRNRILEEREENWAYFAAKTARNPDGAIALSFILNESNKVPWEAYEAIAKRQLKAGVKMYAGTGHVHENYSLEKALRKKEMHVEKFKTVVSDTSGLLIKSYKKA